MNGCALKKSKRAKDKDERRKLRTNRGVPVHLEMTIRQAKSEDPSSTCWCYSCWSVIKQVHAQVTMLNARRREEKKFGKCTLRTR